MPLEIFERFDLEPLSKWVVFDEYALYDANLLIMFRRYVQFEEEDHVWIFISQNRQQFRLQSITAQKSNTATVSMTQAPWSRKSFTTHIVGCGYHRYFITKVWAASDHESALCGREHWSRLIPVGKYTSANRTGGPSGGNLCEAFPNWSEPTCIIEKTTENESENYDWTILNVEILVLKFVYGIMS